MSRYIFTISVVCVLSLLVFLPQPIKAECLTFAPGEMGQTDIAGLADKYFGADRFFIFVGMSGERYLPDSLQRDNIVKIATEYLKWRMLPCTGHDQVEVIEDFHDKRLRQENILIAYIEIKRLGAVSESSKSPLGYRPNTVMIRAQYYRTAPYSKPQYFDGKISYLSLDHNDGKFAERIKQYIKGVLKPELKSSGFR